MKQVIRDGKGHAWEGFYPGIFGRKNKNTTYRRQYAEEPMLFLKPDMTYLPVILRGKTKIKHVMTAALVEGDAYTVHNKPVIGSAILQMHSVYSNRKGDKILKYEWFNAAIKGYRYRVYYEDSASTS